MSNPYNSVPKKTNSAFSPSYFLFFGLFRNKQQLVSHMKFQSAVGYQVFVVALHYHNESSLGQVHVFEGIAFRVEHLPGGGDLAQVGVEMSENELDDQEDDEQIFIEVLQ